MKDYFFDKYPEVYTPALEGGKDGRWKRERLQKRYEHIIEPIKEQIKGSRCLTLGGLTGRFPLALLEAGCKHVITIEKTHFILLEDNLNKYFGKEPERFTVYGDDFYYALPKIKTKIDILLCTGVYYHICSHFQLIQLMTQLQPKLIVLDSIFCKNNWDIRFQSGPHYGLEGKASVPLTGSFFDACGYKMNEIFWDKEDTTHRSLADYRRKDRRTFQVVPKL